MQIQAWCLFIVFRLVIADDSNDSTQILYKSGSNLKDKTAVISTTETFKAFVEESSVWVDKSKFIEYVWERSDVHVFLITAPKRWCKTINLSMFGYYSQLAVDSHGDPYSRISSPNYKYFVEGQVVTDGNTEYLNKRPLIHTYKRNGEHLAMHPVILLNGAELRYDEPLQSLQCMVTRAYITADRLEKRLNTLTKQGARKNRDLAAANLQRFQLYKSNRLALSKQELANSIWTLSKIFFETYKKKVVILFDECEHVIGNVFLGKTKSDPITDNFLHTFMISTFKDNAYLAKAIITGILPIAEQTGLANVNNIESFNIFGNKSISMSPFYGILEHGFYCDYLPLDGV